jgi:integrase
MKKLKTDKRGRVRFLSSDERTRLFSALQERERLRRERRDRFNVWRLARHRVALPRLEAVFTDYLQPLIRTWLGTGLRKTEALLLRWRNLDFEHELVTVPGEIAKSGQSRVVPMPPELKQCLLIWREQKGNPSADDWVFTRKGERIRGVYRAWRALMKLAHIKNFRIHDCRHDYASRLAMADVSLQTIAELLGHEDLSMVQRYAHLSQKHLRDSTRRLAPDPMPANIDPSCNLQPGVSEVDNNLPIAA